jgi:aminoacrylate hydrolase
MVLRYDIVGSQRADAPAILLSAGLGGAGAYWRPQLDALSRDFRVILYDHFGTGLNPGTLPAGYSIADMADDVGGILDDAEIEACHFIGHALGGLVGLEFARRHPKRLCSLIVVNGWAKLDPHTARCFAVRQELLRHGGPASYARAQPIFLYPAVWLSRNAERVAAEEAHGVRTFQGEANLLARIAALSQFDISGELSAITVPALIVSSADDMLVPATCSDVLEEGIPNAIRVRMATGGHSCNVTEADEFNRAVGDFLARWPHPATTR